MKHQITLNFECGDKTCALKPGKFCEHVGRIDFGMNQVCMLFGNTPLERNDGWVQRCPECLDKAATAPVAATVQEEFFIIAATRADGKVPSLHKAYGDRMYFMEDDAKYAADYRTNEFCSFDVFRFLATKEDPACS